MKKALIVIDMQNDFITGRLGTKEAQNILPNAKKKIEEYDKNHCLIIFTRDTHANDYLETSEGRRLPIKHCIWQTEGWEIHKDLKCIMPKYIDKCDNFGWAYWKDEISFYDIDEIEIIGVCTDICVITNALILKTAFPNTKIIVDSKCCAGVTKKSHEAALMVMKMCQIEVM